MEALMSNMPKHQTLLLPLIHRRYSEINLKSNFNNEDRRLLSGQLKS